MTARTNKSAMTLILVRDGILDARFLKSFQAQPAAITSAAGPSLRVRIITAHRQAIINAQAHSFANNLCLGFLQERRVDAESALTFDGRLRGQVRQLLELA